MFRSCRITVTGLVQGVAYRASAQSEAESLGLAGTVRNLPDGSVFIEVEGDDQRIEKFLTWCREGPPAAVVENIEVVPSERGDFSGFRILR